MDDDERNAYYSTPLGRPDLEAVGAFWLRFLQTTGHNEPSDAGRPVPLGPPTPFCFGDSVELADELIELVLHGLKRATASTIAELEAEGEATPAVGDLSIVTDGSMRPRALLETTDVRVGPLSSVDDQSAWDEGEGDRTRDWWLDAHTWSFTRSFQRLGLEFHPDIPVVFERFIIRYQED